MPHATSVAKLLERGDDKAVAIAAPGREPLTYKALRQHVATTVAALNQWGVGRNDPVAIVLPNGPEMATAFVAIAACATTAPLNPGYKVDEFEFYLTDLGAKLLGDRDRRTGAGQRCRRAV
jgi:acyl-coenzyme A synthetase/AMP-(fatty) acid ligase